MLLTMAQNKEFHKHQKEVRFYAAKIQVSSKHREGEGYLIRGIFHGGRKYREEKDLKEREKKKSLLCISFFLL